MESEAMYETLELDAPGAVLVESASRIRASLRMAIARGEFEAAPVETVPFLVLIVCSRGSGRHMVDFVEYDVQVGTTMLVPPGHVQRWELTDDFEAQVVVFDTTDVPELPLLSRVLGLAPCTQLGVEHEWVQHTVAWLEQDLAANHDQAMAASLVRVVLDVIARRMRSDRSGVSPSVHRVASAFAESVEANPSQRRVSWHARTIGASTRSLTRATAELFRQPPKALIDARTLAEAQRRLVWSDDDISVIAYDLGFGEPSSFTKFFSSRTGVSPTSFRSEVGGY